MKDFDNNKEQEADNDQTPEFLKQLIHEQMQERNSKQPALDNARNANPDMPIKSFKRDYRMPNKSFVRDYGEPVNKNFIRNTYNESEITRITTKEIIPVKFCGCGEPIKLRVDENHCPVCGQPYPSALN